MSMPYPRRKGESRSSFALRVNQALKDAGVPSVITKHEASRLLDPAPRHWEGDHWSPVSRAEVARRIAGGKR